MKPGQPRGLPECRHRYQPSTRVPRSPNCLSPVAETPSSKQWTWDDGNGSQFFAQDPCRPLFAVGTGKFHQRRTHFSSLTISHLATLDFLTGGPSRRAANYKRMTDTVPPTLIQQVQYSLIARPAPPPPPSFAARPSLFATSNRFILPTPPNPAAGVHQIRACSTSAPLLHREAGFPILVPLLGLLKSSAFLNVAMMMSRIALTVLPLSVRGKILYAVRERYLKDPENASAWMRRFATSGGEIIKNGRLGRFNTFLLPLLVLAPIILTAAIIAASVERTPVTGRLRVMMLSPVEEAELTASILSCGETARAPSRDWVTILRSVLDLGDEGYSPTTGRRILLGGEVLDSRDWRVRWTEAVLRRLESGVPALAMKDAGAPSGEQLLQPPPTRWPLAPRTTVTSAIGMGWKGDSLVMGKHVDGGTGAPTRGQLACEYDLLVIDREDQNAFSFGFGCDEVDAGVDSQGRRGVVVVYTGGLSFPPFILS